MKAKPANVELVAKYESSKALVGRASHRIQMLRYSFATEFRCTSMSLICLSSGQQGTKPWILVEVRL